MTAPTPPRRRWAVVRSAFGRSEDPYAGADLSAARSSVALIALLSAVLTLAFLPMTPPTDAAGALGWVVAAALVAASGAVVWWLADHSRPIGFDHLLAIGYVGVAAVALLDWMAGGHSPFTLLLLLWLGSGVGVHPPRRAAPFLLAVVAAGALPLAYGPWDDSLARDVAASSLLWLAIGVVLMVLIASVRAQRVRMRTAERTVRAQAELAAKRVSDLQQVTDAALAQLPLDELLHELLARIGSVLEVEVAAIFLTDERDEALVVRAAHGGVESSEGARIAMGDGCAGRAAAGRETVLVEDVDDPANLDPPFRLPGIRALLGEPLRVDGRVIGVVEVGSARGQRFSQDDVRLLRLAADRLSQAIERTRLNERAHHIAETLQRALLPDRLPRIPGVALASRYLPGGPGTDVGGDWYDVLAYVDGRVGLVMGDVVGRGVAAAALMGQLRNALRVYALEHDRPAAILDGMNVMLTQLDPGQMATAVDVVFDPGSGALSFAAAGHPPPVVLRPGGAAGFLEATPSVPLGVMPYGRYSEYGGALEPGTTLLLYTDGLVERRGTPLREGLRQLREAVEAGPAEPEALCDHVLRTLLPEGAPGDDVALLAMRSEPLAGPHLHMELPADADELAVVRHSMERWLGAAHVDEADARRVTLACNEACMNAIEHAYRAGEAAFEVDAWLEESEVDVTVRDRGRWREPRETHVGGRGLGMMRALMDEVAVEPGPEGTTVRLRRAVRRGEAGA